MDRPLFVQKFLNQAHSKPLLGYWTSKSFAIRSNPFSFLNRSMSDLPLFSGQIVKIVTPVTQIAFLLWGG